ncbi:MAG: BCD family MFS transporter [Pseudomonadota bacterium]
MSAAHPLGWVGIVRLGLVQLALGGIVVLTTSAFNRIMVVELAFAAIVPGALVTLRELIQLSRPRFGYGSDRGGRRTPWIVGGIATMALGVVLAALAIAWAERATGSGLALAVVGYLLIGLGGASAGTSVLALLATHVMPERRAAAATIVWVMLIFGFVVTAASAGAMLDPYSSSRLVAVTTVIAVAAVLLSVAAMWRLEGTPRVPVAEAGTATFAGALRDVLTEPRAFRFTIFVFVSMLAYSTQDLILEPYAGLVFGLTPGESTSLTSNQHGGVLVGMLTVALLGSRFGKGKDSWLRRTAAVGCIGSALVLITLAAGGFEGVGWPIERAVFVLGFANGVFAVAAIGSMMSLAGAGQKQREGTRMGVWGAAQAVSLAIGGFLGTVAVDVLRAVFGAPVPAYASVFVAEALLFLVAAWLALWVGRAAITPVTTPPGGDVATATIAR